MFNYHIGDKGKPFKLGNKIENNISAIMPYNKAVMEI